MRLERLAYAGVGVAALSFGLGSGIGARWALVFISVGLALLWLLGQRYQRLFVGYLAMLGFVAAAMAAVLVGAPTFWLLLSIVATLVAWDLDRFRQRLRSAERVVDEDTMVRAHLRRLGVVAGVGLVCGGVALSFELTLAFGWVLVLAVLALLGLSRAIRFVREASD